MAGLPDAALPAAYRDWRKLLARGAGFLAALTVLTAILAIKLGETDFMKATPTSADYLRRLLIVVTVYGCAGTAVLIAAHFAPQRLALRAPILMAALIGGILAGYSATIGLDAMAAIWRSDPIRTFTAPAGFLGLGILGVALLLMTERDQQARRLLHEEQRRLADAERTTTEARLSALQSQVEPHFLFNTLAHLQRLYATDAAAGRTMMRDLIRYIGDTQPALQRASIPLREDARLALAYLNLQQVRMRDRLVFMLDISDAAATAQVPPLTLTTLVENAIKHGLAPLSAGGQIRISAVADADAVRVDVADNGQGLQISSGSGVGLANLRARLELLHGAAARLDLQPNHPRGVVATVHLPVACAETA